jgi:hypothetical protein
MSTYSIGSLSGYLQSVLYPAFPLAANKQSDIAPSAVPVQPDTTQLSPLGSFLSELQQIQQSDPAQYQQLTHQIADNLQRAAQTAQADGNTTAANELKQFATDFNTAAQTGQLPDLSSSTSSSSLDTSLLVNQYQAAYLANGAQSGAQSPLGIILNTLSNAGISRASNS